MQPTKKLTPSAQSGFTLVELSIVLVIIGLIVGGVLVGQSLIAAAKVRAQLTQLDQYDAAVNAFQAKFNCLPGDCTAASGVTFNGGTAATGNGDNLITYDAAWTDASVESAVAWPEMATQGMIAGTYTPPANLGAFPGTGLPAARLGGFVMLGASNTTNYYVLSSYTTGDTQTEPSIAADAALAIDTKRDDGLATTGFVVALDSDTGPFTAAVAPGVVDAADCIGSVGGTSYQAGSATASCIMRVRISG